MADPSCLPAWGLLALSALACDPDPGRAARRDSTVLAEREARLTEAAARTDAGSGAPLAARLREVGVAVDDKVLGDEHAPVPHAYQFLLETPAAQETVEDLVAFLDRATSNSH